MNLNILDKMLFPWITQEKGYIFRITAIQNLPFVLTHGILCRNYAPSDPNFINIGEGDIIEKRDKKQIEIAPFGHLSDYVPFYFAPRSPMLGRIKTYNFFPQEDIIYLVSNIQKAVDSRIPFVFTDGHAIKEFTLFRNSIQDLNIVDWDIMKQKYWNITPDDNDRMRRRMAEFLVHNHFPVGLITSIGVKNEQKAQEVKEILDKFAKTLNVNILPEWYF